MDYTRDVEEDAFDFITDIEADIKAAIINGEEDISEITCDETGYGKIRGAFHESVTDERVKRLVEAHGSTMGTGGYDDTK